MRNGIVCRFVAHLRCVGIIGCALCHIAVTNSATMKWDFISTDAWPAADTFMIAFNGEWIPALYLCIWVWSWAWVCQNFSISRMIVIIITLSTTEEQAGEMENMCHHSLEHNWARATSLCNVRAGTKCPRMTTVVAGCLLDARITFDLVRVSKQTKQALLQWLVGYSQSYYDKRRLGK